MLDSPSKSQCFASRCSCNILTGAILNELELMEIRLVKVMQSKFVFMFKFPLL